MFENIEDIHKSYPNMQAVSLSIDRSFQNTTYSKKNTIHIANTADALRTDAFYAVGNVGVWESISSKLDESVNWLGEILKSDSIKALAIEIRGLNNKDENEASFTMPCLPDLEHLRLKISDSRLKNLYIEGSPTLLSLDVSIHHGTGIVWREVGKMPALENLKITFMQVESLPAILEQLNPETLTSLNFKQIKKFSFLPAAKKKDKDKNALPVSASAMEQFSNLKSLELVGNNLNALPFSLAPFTKLEKLDLSENKLTNFPASIAVLHTLQKLDVTKTSVIKAKHVRSNDELLKMIQEFEKNNIPVEKRITLFRILIQDETIGNELSINEIFELYNLAKQPKIAQQILALCEKKQDKQTLVSLQKAGKLQHIALLGKMPSMEYEQVETFLQNYLITLSPKITPQTQAVCIGEKATATQIKSVIAQVLPVCFAEQMRALMQCLETPYLQEIDEASAQNLENLLLSGDENSILLALQMMKSGGLPDLVFEFLCLDYTEKYSACRQEKFELLKQYATSSQSIALKKIGDSAFPKRLRTLIDSPEFDAVKLTTMTAKFFDAPEMHGKGHSFMYYWRGILWQQEGEALDIWVRHHLDEEGTLHINSNTTKLDALPKTLTGNTLIRKLVMHEYYLTPPAKRILASLPHLTALKILYDANFKETENTIKERCQNLPAHIEVSFSVIKK